MGSSKAELSWHGTTLGFRTASVLGRSVDGPVVVVRAPGQALPVLPSGVEVVADAVADRGPLQGLAAGLAAVADRAEAAFVCSTDLPFLHPAFIQRVLRALAPGVDVVLPVAHGFRQPLAAAYRTSLVGLITDRLAAGELRLGMLFDHCVVRGLDEEALLADPTLAAADPTLASLINVNTREEYEAALARRSSGDGAG
jgi:molybdenum cofactor guanylyltransferase